MGLLYILKGVKNMLEFIAWNHEVDRLEMAIKEVNRKIEYRNLQILGPVPPTEIRSGYRGGRTSDEYLESRNDPIVQKLYVEKNNLETQLDFVRRTGDVLDAIDTEGVF